MLLPSAFACGDSSQPPSQQSRSRTHLFASPPLSPISSSSSTPTITNLFQSCRALQSMLTTPTQLPSPPTLHADIPPSSAMIRNPATKLRLRIPSSAKTVGPEFGDRKRITKRTQREAPRGVSKRWRATGDDMDYENSGDVSEQEHEDSVNPGPSTPTCRRRMAPEILPLGLERSDFHTLRLAEMEKTGDDGTLAFSAGSSSHRVESEMRRDEEYEVDGNEWSTEEDRMLVELVLEKLKLSKSDWQDCARSLGKDRGSVGKRWKSLMGAGEVGLKGKRKTRTKLHSTWR
ncbi:hypothetical protein DSL72_004282 [Monilinia vaccinii-corymbosi]|uniref:Myb-like domain-containing protein n=1 Tax=Monilinia vaccinii-corymbosi TaxID=61207 RepID=A0A8A3NVM9_9HELO|nr:hypothetical protein DSL72_004282 [Monilinia vaccinii-corymbosi]